MNQSEILRKAREADDRRSREDPTAVDGWQVTQHAVQRFVERFGSTPKTAPARLAHHASAGRSIGKGLVQSGAVVLVLDGRRIITVYKPDKPHVQGKIFNAIHGTP